MSASRQIRELFDAPGTIVAGNTYTAKCTKLKNAIQGRPNHAILMLVKFTVLYQVAQAATIPGFLLATALKSIYLKSAGHAFIKGLDGEDLAFLSALRYGTYIRTLPQDVAHVGAAADQTVDVEVVIPIANFGGQPGTEDDGAIPVRMLDETKGENGLSFEVAASFDGLADVTIDEIQNVEITAITKPLDHLRVPTPWRMRTYSEVQTDFRVRIDGRSISSVIRDRKLAAGTPSSPPDHSGYDGIELVLNDTAIFNSRSAADLALMHNLQAPIGASLLDEAAPSYLPISVAQPGTKRSKMDSGVIQVVLQTRNDSAAAALTKSRLLVHETGRSSHSVTHKFLQELGAPADAANDSRAAAELSARFANKDGRSASHPLRDVLDAAAFWAGMNGEGYTVPARKFNRQLKRL